MSISSCFSIVAAYANTPDRGLWPHPWPHRAGQRYIEFRPAMAKVEPTIKETHMSDLEKFRQETHAWLEANCPPEMRRPMTSDEDTFWGGRNTKFSSEPQRVWFERMRDKGWTVPHWPKEYGGAGLDPEQAKIVRQEMAAIGARQPLVSFGISMLRPALLKYGHDEAYTADFRPLAGLRDVLRQRPGTEGQCGRHRQPRLGRREISAAARARDDLRHGRARRRPAARSGRRRLRGHRRAGPSGRSNAARTNRHLRDRRGGVGLRRRTRGRSGEGRAIPSGVFLGDEILRYRAEQGPLRDPDVGGRRRCTGIGKRSVERRRPTAARRAEPE